MSEDKPAATPASESMPPSEASTIWDELSAWGQSLADWQRFIVSHAVRDGALSPERVDEAYRLFLRHFELDRGDEELPEIPDSVTGRAASSGVAPLSLREMKSLKNVNAIPETSKLTFGDGLTVIYGHNAAGKSGFVRMLSSACFSRSDPKILRNVFDSSASDEPATAEFVVDKGNGSEETIPFTDGDENSDLRRVSVFDSSVARIHLAQENELGFQPAGFDVFDEMIRVLGLISAKLDADISERNKPNKFDQLFSDPGTVADRIAELDSDTDLDALRALAAFDEAEKERLEEVGRQEKELRAKSPVETLKVLSTARADIEAIRTRIAELSSQLGDSACGDARTLLQEHRTATLAAVEAGGKTVSHPDLTQTGTEEWDAFVDASRTLGRAEKDSYPSEGDPCLLCHRPLDGPSATLIRRMWNYLDDEARAAAQAVDDRVNARIAELRELETNLLPPESRIRADLSRHDPDLVARLDNTSAVLAERRDGLARALYEGKAADLPSGDLVFSDAEMAQALADIDTQEAALKDGKFDEQLAKLEAEHITLRQRQVLSKNITDVVTLVEDLKWIKSAEGAKRSGTNTRFVTDKQRGLFETLIEGAYKARLQEECGNLNCALPVEFTARGSAGRTLRGLKVQGGYKPEDIFSEGEQRALSLADFLTEINLDPGSSGIVLDDPVTSMDHLRKGAIAKRLVKEAAERQVVVFTHDLVFMTHLANYADEAELPITNHWVERQGDVPGKVNIDETPATIRAYRKTTKAKEFLERAKKASGQGKVDLVRQGAGALRRTIEEVVVEYYFKGAVKRWDEQIRLGAIGKISWSDDVADEIVALQDETSRLLEGHSNSDEYAGGMPTTEELEAAIGRVDALIVEARKERK